jgi:hypothetical protein
VAWWGGEGAAAGLKCAGVEKKGHRPPRVGEGRAPFVGWLGIGVGDDVDGLEARKWYRK